MTPHRSHHPGVTDAVTVAGCAVNGARDQTAAGPPLSPRPAAAILSPAEVERRLDWLDDARREMCEIER